MTKASWSASQIDGLFGGGEGSFEDTSRTQDDV